MSTDYAYTFDAFNRRMDDEGYNSKEAHVTVTVMGTEEAEALKTAKGLVTREHYRLTDICELDVDLMPIKPSNY